MDDFTNKLTFLALRWIFSSGRNEQFSQCKSPEEIKELIYKILQPESESFDKGSKFINYQALYQWFENRKENLNTSAN